MSKKVIDITRIDSPMEEDDSRDEFIGRLSLFDLIMAGHLDQDDLYDAIKRQHPALVLGYARNGDLEKIREVIGRPFFLLEEAERLAWEEKKSSMEADNYKDGEDDDFWSDMYNSVGPNIPPTYN